LQFTKLARDLQVPGGGTKEQQAGTPADEAGDVNALAANVDDLDLR